MAAPRRARPETPRARQENRRRGVAQLESAHELAARTDDDDYDDDYDDYDYDYDDDDDDARASERARAPPRKRSGFQTPAPARTQ